MKKSLIIIASALLFAVAAATGDRLRYDSAVFADSAGPAGGPRAVRVEYPPCVPGVREDRCIQLYERGVRRSYQRWLAAHGRGGEQVAARGPSRARAYPACRGRNDDRCEQRSARRHTRAVRHARTVRAVRHARAHQTHRATATRAVAHRRAVAARPAQQRLAPVVRQVRRTTTTTTTRTVQRQRPAPAPAHRHSPPPVGTPGI